MYLPILWISILLMIYGAVRFGLAKWRQEDDPAKHILWIPAAAFFYAGFIAMVTWIFH